MKAFITVLQLEVVILIFMSRVSPLEASLSFLFVVYYPQNTGAPLPLILYPASRFWTWNLLYFNAIEKPKVWQCV